MNYFWFCFPSKSLYSVGSRESTIQGSCLIFSGMLSDFSLSRAHRRLYFCGRLQYKLFLFLCNGCTYSRIQTFLIFTKVIFIRIPRHKRNVFVFLLILLCPVWLSPVTESSVRLAIYLFERYKSYKKICFSHKQDDRAFASHSLTSFSYFAQKIFLLLNDQTYF